MRATCVWVLPFASPVVSECRGWLTVAQVVTEGKEGRKAREGEVETKPALRSGVPSFLCSRLPRR